MSGPLGCAMMCQATARTSLMLPVLLIWVVLLANLQTGATSVITPAILDRGQHPSLPNLCQ